MTERPDATILMFAARQFARSLNATQSALFLNLVKDQRGMAATVGEVVGQLKLKGNNSNESDLETSTLAALRYALGRSSAAVPLVADHIVKNADNLSDVAKEEICSAIDTAITYRQAGHAMDVRCWSSVSAALQPVPAMQF